jgi:hypothetical protein
MAEKKADKKKKGGGVEKLNELRNTAKSDLAAPESAIVPVEGAQVEDEPGKPEAATVKEGETHAMYESHNLLTSPSSIAERVEEEQEKGLSTDVIARRQQEEFLAQEDQVRHDTEVEHDPMEDAAEERDAQVAEEEKNRERVSR